MLILQGEEFLTVKEAARLLGVKPETLYAYVSRGVLQSYRQGIKRQRLYRRAEIEALLRVAPSTPAAALRARGGKLRTRAIEIPLAESWIRD
jgi:citrate synthase